MRRKERRATTNHLRVLWTLFFLPTCAALSAVALPSRTNGLSIHKSDSIFQEANPITFSAWNQTVYLATHQRIRKRRTLRRLSEILSILAGEVFRPLLCSAVKAPTNVLSDDFWSQRITGMRGKTISNAERVAKGFQQLGPTFTKLGQALATRPDILHVPLADALASLQDSMSPFDNLTAKRIIRREILAKGLDNPYVNTKATTRAFLDSLSEKPVAAATIAQVYKAYLPGYGHVAVKVQRPGIRNKVEGDATLFHSLARWLEALQWPRWTLARGQKVFGKLQLVNTVDEFTTRVFEEMDFVREAENIERFGNLYCHKRGLSRSVQVVVPELIPELCSSRVLVMQWIEGTKLLDVCDDCQERQSETQENLALVKKAIECTLSQLFDTGILHSEPHSGNLLKVKDKHGVAELGYLDFGLVGYVPQNFREGIVCAVVQLVFARNIEAVADLCGDLELLPREMLTQPKERKRLVNALKRALDDVLLWPKDEKGKSTTIPTVRFENLLSSLANLVSAFEFSVQPYFLNNARALATLEGIALKLDPDFNILRVIYPFAINQLMTNPSVSRKTEETFLSICRSPKTKLFSVSRSQMLINDWALLTGYRKRRIIWDLTVSTGGRRVLRRIVQEWFLKRARKVRMWFETTGA